MGFGLLCVGYLTLLLFRIVPIEPVGFYIITVALERLEGQCRAFRPAKLAAGALFFESVFGALLWVNDRTGSFLPALSAEWITNAESLLYYAGLLVFHCLLYRGLLAISRQVGYSAGLRRTRFSLITMGIFFAGELTAVLFPGIAVYLARPLVLFQLIWLCSTMFALLGCYRMIVTDEMLEKEEKQYTDFLEKNSRRKQNAPLSKKKNTKEKAGHRFSVRGGKNR